MNSNNKNKHKNKFIFLERRLAYIEDKLKFYENAKGPIISTLPVKIYDIFPLEKQQYKPVFFLIVLIIKKNDKRCPIVKIPKQTFINLAYKKSSVTIYDYLHTDEFAGKTIHNNEWIWVKI